MIFLENIRWDTCLKRRKSSGTDFPNIINYLPIGINHKPAEKNKHKPHASESEEPLKP